MPDEAPERTGDVVLWPEGRAALRSNHVSFDWTDGDLTYRVSLEAWRPLETSVATLREIVHSIGNRPGRSISG